MTCEGEIAWCQGLGERGLAAYADAAPAIVIWDMKMEEPVQMVHLAHLGTGPGRLGGRRSPPARVAASPDGAWIAVAARDHDGDAVTIRLQVFETRGMFTVLDVTQQLRSGDEAQWAQDLMFDQRGRRIILGVDHARLQVWFPMCLMHGTSTISLPLLQGVPFDASAPSAGLTSPALSSPGLASPGQPAAVDQRKSSPPKLCSFSHNGNALAIAFGSGMETDQPDEEVEVMVWKLCFCKPSGKGKVAPPLRGAWNGLHALALDSDGSRCVIAIKAALDTPARIVLWELGRPKVQDWALKMDADEGTVAAHLDQQYVWTTKPGDPPVAAVGFTTGGEVVVCDSMGVLTFYTTGNPNPTYKSNRQRSPGATCSISSIGSHAVVLKKNLPLEIWNLQTHQVTTYLDFTRQGFPYNGMTACGGLFLDGGVLLGNVGRGPLFVKPEGDLVVDMCGQEALIVGIEDGHPCVSVFNNRTLGLIRASQEHGERIEEFTGIRKGVKELRYAQDGQDVKEMDHSILAVSGNGRVVAAVTEYGSMRIWTPFAADMCLPNYRQLELQYSPFEGKEEKMMELLEEHGAAILNHPNHEGKSLFFRSVEEKNSAWVTVMVDWAREEGKTICLHACGPGAMAAKDPQTRNRDELSALDIALAARDGEMVRLLLDVVLDGPTTFSEAASVVEHSFPDLLRVFPALFEEALCSDRILRPVEASGLARKLEAPVDVFKNDNSFVVGAHNAQIYSSRQLSALFAECNSRVAKLLKEREKHVAELNHLDHHHGQMNYTCSDRTLPISCKILPWSNAAKVGREGALRQLRFRQPHADAFPSMAMKAIVAYKWDLFARRKMLVDLGLHVLLLLSYSLFWVKWENLLEIFAVESLPDWQYEVMLWISFLLAIWKLGQKGRQIRYLWRDGLEMEQRMTKRDAQGMNFGDSMWHFSGLRHWARSKWNILETVAYISVVATSIPEAIDYRTIGSKETLDVWEYYQSTHCMAAATSLLLWWKLLYYAAATRATAPLVVALFQVFWDVRYFLVLFAANFLGFTTAVHILLLDDVKCQCADFESTATQFTLNATGNITSLQGVFNEFDGGETNFKGESECESTPRGYLDPEDRDLFCGAYAGWYRVSVTMVGMMLGQFDPATFNLASNRYFSVMIFSLYLLISFIMLLNLLIAIISDSFDNVRRNEEAQFLIGRAEVIEDLEDRMLSRHKEAVQKKIGRYLYVLEPEEKSRHGIWHGRIRALENTVKEELLKVERRLDSKVDGVKMEILEALQGGPIRRTVSRLRGDISLRWTG
ncbi:unnamed protein product [Ostreobium quekettii]|uniref:Ion transport domain-containing protein n=1 Tax=Ostreobium quekettii TaxID=121088 RepID=A0A8S1JIC2_9CHLO|nr:unnamed protein product [Ostreobium quekettii]